MIVLTNSDNGELAFRPLFEKILGNTVTPWEWEGYTPDYIERSRQTAVAAHTLPLVIRQLAATIFPDSTRSAGAAADGSFGSGELVGSMAPTSSSFLPTCALSAVGLAISR